MMYLSETGISYSEGFFELDNGRIINTFTGRSVGVMVRKIPSTTYLFKSKKRSFLDRWRDGDKEAYKRVHTIPPESEGSLVTTMRLLEEAV